MPPKTVATKGQSSDGWFGEITEDHCRNRSQDAHC
jgi:hypothetical protein